MFLLAVQVTHVCILRCCGVGILPIVQHLCMPLCMTCRIFFLNIYVIQLNERAMTNACINALPGILLCLAA